jgi:hypothetical protein
MVRSHKQVARARLNLKQTSYNHNSFRSIELLMISKPIDTQMFNLHIIYKVVYSTRDIETAAGLSLC